MPGAAASRRSSRPRRRGGQPRSQVPRRQDAERISTTRHAFVTLPSPHCHQICKHLKLCLRLCSRDYLALPFMSVVTDPNQSTRAAALPHPPVLKPVQFLDRDHSILAFNERVLDWARRPDVPLLERLRYLCIVSSNLDEFFEVRAAPHLTAALAGDQKGLYSNESLMVRTPSMNQRFHPSNSATFINQ